MGKVNEKTLAVATAAYATFHGPDVDLEGMRKGFDRMLPEPAADVTVDEATLGGVAGRWVSTPEAGDTTILYVHGGGGALGSSFAYRDLASRVARVAKARLFVPDYSLSPENQFPAGLDDVKAAYDALLEIDGVTPDKLVVVGDSAGGGLSLGLTLSLRDAGKPLPRAVVALSPVTDWTASGDSMQNMAPEDDPLVTLETTVNMAGMYLGSHDPKDPIASPVFADFTGFPPLLVQVGTAERLYDDSTRVVDAARSAGVEVEFQVYEGQVHVFQMFAYELEVAQAAIDAVGAFVRAHQDS